MVSERWWEREGWAAELAPYAIVIRAFLEERVSAEEFEVLYLTIFKSDEKEYPNEVFDILDTLFADVDDFCPDEELREAVEGIDERELMARVRTAQDDLSEVTKQHPR